MNHRGNTVFDKTGPTYSTFMRYHDYLKENVIIVGDFNDNRIWDKQYVKRGNFSNLASFFGSSEIKSCYHGRCVGGAIAQFVEEHGIQGFAPTQGHIPSGVPYLGHARRDIISGKIEKVMIIGKGSLFLGRLTNLFDGVSFILQRNNGTTGKAESQNSKEKLNIIVAQAFRQVAELLSEEDRSGGK